MEILAYVLVLLIGVVLFGLTIRFAIISLGYQKKKCSKCKGYLQNAQHYNNIWIRRNFYRDYIYYVYVYRVNGKEFVLSCGIEGKKENLPKFVEVIYQTKNPKYSYIHKLTFPQEPILLIFLIPLCLVFVICGIVLI